MKKATIADMNTVVQALRRHETVCMQRRPTRWKFGTQNYGEVPRYINQADGDCWDVFAPGYERVLNTKRKYRCRQILGIFLLNNGNHKIAIQLFIPGYDAHVARSEIATFCQQYTAITGHLGTWTELTSLQLSPPFDIRPCFFEHDQGAKKLDTARSELSKNQLLASTHAIRARVSETLDCCVENLECDENESDRDL